MNEGLWVARVQGDIVDLGSSPDRVGVVRCHRGSLDPAVSLYVRNPDVPAYRSRPYPKRRREGEDLGAARWRVSRALEPSYADFFMAVEEAEGQETA